MFFVKKYRYGFWSSQKISSQMFPRIMDNGSNQAHLFARRQVTNNLIPSPYEHSQDFWIYSYTLQVSITWWKHFRCTVYFLHWWVTIPFSFVTLNRPKYLYHIQKHINAGDNLVKLLLTNRDSWLYPKIVVYLIWTKQKQAQKKGFLKLLFSCNKNLFEHLYMIGFSVNYPTSSVRSGN